MMTENLAEMGDKEQMESVSPRLECTTGGHNKVKENKKRTIIRFFGFMRIPFSRMMVSAAIVTITLANGGGEPPDWQIFVGIVILLLVYSIISFIELNKAENDDAPYMASHDMQSSSTDQKISCEIGNFCVCCFGIGMIIETIVTINGIQDISYRTFVRNMVVLPIGLPIAMPTVLILTLKMGSRRLSQEGAIIKSVARIEEMAGMDVICCEKTGTLTMNKILHQEKGRDLRMASVISLSSSLLGKNCDESTAVEELIEKIDRFAGVRLDHMCEIIQHLQARKHICGMIGKWVNDAPALKKADIGIAVVDACDAAQNASDIVLTVPGVRVSLHAILTSRAIFQGMKKYSISALSVTIRNLLGFMLLALIWNFDFPPIMVLTMAILNSGDMITIPKSRLKPSLLPDRWKASDTITTGVALGVYLAMTTLLFFSVTYNTDFFTRVFGVKAIGRNAQPDLAMLASAVYLQVSIISPSLIFVTRSTSLSYSGVRLVVGMYIVVELIATLITVYVNCSFATIKGIGWGWAGIIWLYSIITYILPDIITYVLGGTFRIFSGRVSLRGYSMVTMSRKFSRSL